MGEHREPVGESSVPKSHRQEWRVKTREEVAPSSLSWETSIWGQVPEGSIEEVVGAGSIQRRGKCSSLASSSRHGRDVLLGPRQQPLPSFVTSGES